MLPSIQFGWWNCCGLLERTILISISIILFSNLSQCYTSHNDYSRLHQHGHIQPPSSASSSSLSSSSSSSLSSVSVFMPWTIIPPKITMLSHTMTGDTIDILTDSTIHLRCTGQRPLMWTFPNNNSPFDTFEQYANVSVTSSCDEPSDHLPMIKCASDLTIVDAKFDMTGYYTCQYNQSGSGQSNGGTGKFDSNHPVYDRSQMQHQLSSDVADTIYIFVNDAANLIVPYESATDYLFIAVFQSQSATIPCRPTYSDAKVSLWKVHTKQGVPQEIKPNSTLGITYNPKKGFYFDHPRWDSETNVLECQYEVNGQKSVSAISLHWSILPTELHPIIDDTNARHVFHNESFTLRCFVHIEIGVIIVLDWDFPNKNETSKRIFKSHIDTQRVNVNGNSYDTVAINVTVLNASLADQGEYRCNVTDGNGRTFSATKKIVIHDEHQPSTVNFTTDFNISEPLIRDVGDDVRFMVVAHAFPDISLIDLSWYKDGQRLELNTSHYQIEIFSDILTQISFYIQNARASDSGTYTLMGNSSSMSTNISIVVYVSGQPEIVLDNVLDFYVLNKSYELICKSYSHPVSVVWWSWIACNSSETCFSTKPTTPWTNLTIQHNSGTPQLVNGTTVDNQAVVLLDNLRSEYLNVSRLKLEANQSGVYRCSAKNVYNVVKHQPIPFIVMDVDELFSVFCSTDEPTLNDTILFTCKASIFEYKQITWSVKYYDSSLMSVNNSTDLIQTNHNNQYSLTATIVLRSIKLNDSALFTCYATRRNQDKVDHKEIYLNVKNVTVPSIVDSNMANEILEQSANSQIELKCYVSGRPWPLIVWYRNGRQFNTQHDSGIRIEERGQRLIFTRLLEKDSGLYECRATNRGGQVVRKAFLRVRGGFGSGSDDSGIQTGEILFTLFLALVGTVMMIMAVFIGKKIREERMHKRELEFFSKSIFENGQMEMFNPEMPLDEQIDLLPYDSRFEFPKERLKLGRTLGQGAFGRVVKAEAIGLESDESTTTVAVKMLKERADANQRKALMAELKILIHLGRHLNIVNLLGAMTKNLAKGELFVIVEYCEFGNLRHFLLSNRDHFVDQLDPATGHIDPAKLNELVHNYGQTYQNSSVFGGYNLKDYANYNSNGTITSNGNGGIRYIDLLHQNDSNGSNQNSITANNDYINTNGATFGSCESPTIAYYNHNYVGSTWRRRGSQNCRNSGRSNRPVVTTSDLICYSFQCARGMEYLTSRKLIHRDLAARNVLLASNNVVKICDFGLAKDVYKYDNYVKKDDGPLPIKWMAIESISDKIFTSKSDVWSFGILLWEIFTLGKNPYPGIEIDEEFYKRLKNGYRMEKPEFASVEIHQLMLNCWNASPTERPDFTAIANLIGDLMEAEIREHYITLNNPYDEMNEQIFSGSATAIPPNSDYLKMTSMTSGSTEDYLRMREDMNEDEDNDAYQENCNFQTPDGVVEVNNNQHNHNQLSKLNNGNGPHHPNHLQESTIHNNGDNKQDCPIEMIDMQTFNDSSIHYDNFEIVSFTPNHGVAQPNSHNNPHYQHRA